MELGKFPWKLIEDVAKEHNIDADLLAAFVSVESSNNKYAYRFEPEYQWLLDVIKHAKLNGITADSEKTLQMSSFGLCQVMGAVARELGLTGSIFQLLDEKTNLTYCAKLLNKHFKKYNLLDDVIASYNAGSPKKGTNGRYRNQSYVDKVNSARMIIALHRGKGGKT